MLKVSWMTIIFGLGRREESKGPQDGEEHVHEFSIWDRSLIYD